MPKLKKRPMPPPEPAYKFAVGDWVEYFSWNTTPMVARVIHRNGPFGTNGEPLYILGRITEDHEYQTFGVSESDLRPGQAPPAPYSQVPRWETHAPEPR